MKNTYYHTTIKLSDNSDLEKHVAFLATCYLIFSSIFLPDSILRLILKRKESGQPTVFFNDLPSIPEEIRFDELMHIVETSIYQSHSTYSDSYLPPNCKHDYNTINTCILNLGIISDFEFQENFCGTIININRGSCSFKQLFPASASTPLNLTGTFSHICTVCSSDSVVFVNQISLVSEEEKQMLLDIGRGESAPDWTNSHFLNLFQQSVSDYARQTAVVSDYTTLTYSELDYRSDQLAIRLLRKGTAKNSRVGICIQRSSLVLVLILAVMKAGASFVPVDPSLPEERIRFILQDAGIDIFVTDKAFGNTDDLLNKNIVTVSLSDDAESGIVSGILPTLRDPDSLAYIIYTSGSTGLPKGVAVTHASLANLLQAMQKETGICEGQKMIASTSVSFDISYVELLTPLISGAQVIIIDLPTVQNGHLLAEAIYRYRPDYVQLTPAGWHNLMEASIDRKKVTALHILCGGEALPGALAKQLLRFFIEKPGLAGFWNLYGPTETTIWSIIKKIEMKDCERITIGKPLANTQCYIVDKNLRLLPKGSVGELVIAGSGVAAGYINRPELTAETFVIAPFLPEETPIYRTGDYARWLPDNNICLQGRLDDQVKIRGYRIELGEIEFSVRSIPEISRSCVVVREVDPADKKLALYFSATADYLNLHSEKSMAQQIESWQNIYENQYAEPLYRKVEEDIDITIWNDSFTGQKISADHIKEWLDEIISVVLSEPAVTLLELGCGTGLVYNKLAGHIKKYIGSDFSPSGVKKIHDSAASKPGLYPETHLQVCAAHLTETEAYSVDTVVINSVIQYFPNEQYLTLVIEKAISAVRGKGRIIIGDVRDLRLLEAFKTRFCFVRMPDETGIKEFRWSVSQEILKEEQLSVAPSFFYDLSRRFKEISHVEILHKDCSQINEMSLYRYNVIIHLNTPVYTIRSDIYDWNGLNDAIRFAKCDASSFVIRNIPNYKLFPEQQITKLTKEGNVATLGELRQLIKLEDDNNSPVRELILNLKAQGYLVRLLISPDPFCFHLSARKESGFVILDDYRDEYSDKKTHSNIPYEFQAYADLQEMIKEKMRQHLPAYMIPDTFVPILKFPLTYNGKTDKKFLSRLEIASQRKKTLHVPVKTGELGEQLLEIWKSVLYLDDIHPDDNFFVIGGHSLTATRLLSAIKKKLNITLQISDLFKCPTISSLELFLSRNKKEIHGHSGLTLTETMKSGHNGKVPLSYFQESVMLREKKGDCVKLYIPFRLWFKGSLQPDALERAFKELIKRHEILRTVVYYSDEKFLQKCLPPQLWKLERVEIPSHNNTGTEDYIKQFVRSPFNVMEDYLIRAVLITRGEAEHELVFVLHPLAGDGWSISILLNEITFLFNRETNEDLEMLPDLPVQYADFSFWQRMYLSGEVLTLKAAFWKKLLDNGSSLLLPYDFGCSADGERMGEWIRFTIDEALWEKTGNYAVSQNVTPYMVLLAVFCRQLLPYCKDDFLCIGSPIANRTWEEVEPLVGYFANTLPLFLQLKRGQPFHGFVRDIKAQLLEIYANQELPLEMISGLRSGTGELSQEPLFRVTFEYNSMPPIPLSLELTNLETTVREIVQPTMEKDLRYSLTVIGSQCYGGIKYCKNCFEESTVRSFVDEYISLLTGFVSNSSVYDISKV
jgi:amino acid adenylation domain-containing protein